MNNSNLPIKVPPYNLDAEKAVLSALIQYPHTISAVIEQIKKKEYFYNLKHQIIYQTIISMFLNNINVDLITLEENLKKTHKLESVGGIGYLSEICDLTITISHINEYAKIIKDKYIKRKLIESANHIIGSAYSDEHNSNEMLELAGKAFFDISSEMITAEFKSTRDLVMPTFNLIDQLSKNKKAISGLNTGYRVLNNLTMGLQPSELIILAARPSMGKTALGLNLLINVASAEKVPVALFSIEMPKEHIMKRFFSMISDIKHDVILSGKLSVEQLQTLSQYLTKLTESPIFIDDSPKISILEMKSKLRRLCNELKRDIKVVMIDYLQLIEAPKELKSEYEKITFISKSLKNLAREFNMTVIALSQLSRKTEERANRKPQLSDLRGSGTLEQDADIVMLLYRDDYYSENVSETTTPAELVIAKNRQGKLGKVPLMFLKDRLKFVPQSKE